MRCVSFGAALLVVVSAAKEKNSGALSYSCPKGWEQLGDLCSRTVPVKPITKTEVSFSEVSPVEFCPPGYTEDGHECTKEVPMAMEAKSVLHQVPTKVCPKGSQQTKDGCVLTKAVAEKVAEQNHKQVNAQRVSKKTQTVRVKKPVSVSSGPSTKVVKTPLAGYDLVDVSKQLKLPKDEKVFVETCGTGAKGACVIRVPRQSVEEKTATKTVHAPQLVEKTKTLNLKSKVKVARQVCPQGSTETKGGCVVKLTRQVVKVQETPKLVPASLTTDVSKVLKIAKTTLVPKYSCPSGSQGKGETCTVTRTSVAPVTKEIPKTVKVARAVKVPKTVKVPKVVAVPTSTCPKGSTQGGKGKGECVLSTTIQVPYTVEPAVSVCPAGSTDDGGVCISEKRVYAPAEEVPTQTKKSKKGDVSVRMECPSGYEKDSVGLCFKVETSTVPAEILTAVKVAIRSEVVEEVVPAILSYTTRTEFEEATIEEIKIEYETEEVMETTTELASTTYTDQIPAIATYEPVTTYEEVAVTDTIPCAGAGGKGCGGTEMLTESVHTVETEVYEEEVPSVTAYVIEDHVDTQTVTDQIVGSQPQEIAETIHVVVDACGKGGSGCEQEVPTTKVVSFKTVYDTITVTDRKVKVTTTQQEDEVQVAPAYHTVYEEETHETASLQVETVPTTLTETVIKTTTRTVTEEVEAGTVLHSVTATEQACPEGSVGNAKGCIKRVTVPKTVTCPKGAQNKHGVCMEKTSMTVTACPPGSVETGSGCEQNETIPATVIYSEPEPAPKATKEAPQEQKAAPPQQKKSFRV